MPTYEYACSGCGNQWEEVQKISEDPLDTCPKCSQKTAKRQISGGNFILKGGGWYADLYASSGNKSKGETKTESKADAGATKTETSSTAPAKSESAAPPAKAPSTTPSKT